eukprot:14468866-Alexandrium_andersonii.AAC.1
MAEGRQRRACGRSTSAPRALSPLLRTVRGGTVLQECGGSRATVLGASRRGAAAVAMYGAS